MTPETRRRSGLAADWLINLPDRPSDRAPSSILRFRTVLVAQGLPCPLGKFALCVAQR